MGRHLRGQLGRHLRRHRILLLVVLWIAAYANCGISLIDSVLLVLITAVKVVVVIADVVARLLRLLLWQRLPLILTLIIILAGALVGVCLVISLGLVILLRRKIVLLRSEIALVISLPLILVGVLASRLTSVRSCRGPVVCLAVVDWTGI